MATTRYVWEKFSVKTGYKMLERKTTQVPATLIDSDGKLSSYPTVSSTGTVYTDDSYTVAISQKGNESYFLFPNKAQISVPASLPSGKYFARVIDDPDDTGKLAEICYVPEGMLDVKLNWHIEFDNDAGVQRTYYTLTSSYEVINYYVGSTWIPADKIGSAYSASQSAYPSSGYESGHWYELIGSDSITPASVTFEKIYVGSSVKITINPSANLKFGGVITYTIETTEDGENWVERTKSTETEVTLYVPETTTKWGVRVKASDDNGIVDDTYVYGNGVTAATPETRDFLPYNGNIGYVFSKHILDVTIASTQSFNLTATINGATVYSGTGVNGTNAITISDSAFTGLPENEPIEMTVKAELSSGAVTRVYTFRKFSYDHNSLSGVFTGAANALRNQTGDSKQILGANIPDEIMKLPAYKLAEMTATPETVFAGRTFIDQTGEVKAGRGLAKTTTATASDIAHGKTAYNSLGELMTGIGSSQYFQAGSLQPTLENKTYTIPYDAVVSGKKPSCILAYFNTWVGDYATAGRHPSFSPYFFRGAASGQLYGLTTAADGTMLNQNQTAANTTISVGTTSFSVTISKYDYVTGSEFCYILVW